MLARPDPASLRLNVGCGASPTPGWLNLDNSPSVWLARLPWLWPLLSPTQRSFAASVRRTGAKPGHALKLPVPEASCEVVYSSHMMEHLDRSEVRDFLAEALRVLRRGGVLRLALPDLALTVADYLRHGDADRFVSESLMGSTRPKGLRQRLHHLFVGPRHHLWMYDGPSLVRLLTSMGFADVHILAPGETTILRPEALDLYENAEDSVYVEAVRP